MPDSSFPAAPRVAGGAAPWLGQVPWGFFGFASGCGLSLAFFAPAWALPLGLALGWLARRRFPVLMFALAMVAGLAWGTLVVPALGQGPVESLFLDRSPGTPIFLWVRGRTIRAEAWEGGSRVELRLRSFWDGGSWSPTREKVRTYLPVPPPADGSSLQASLRITLPRRATNPGEFDLSKYMDRLGIHLVGSVRDASLVRISQPRSPLPLARYRRALRSALLGDGGREAGLLLAVLLGERGLMSPAQEETLSRSGLYHLVALSGFNVGLVLLVLLGLAHAAGLPPLPRDILSLAIIGAYGLVVAERPSFSRALLMAGIFLVARISARPQPGARSWVLSACLLLALDPRILADTGFQLTFLATAGILFLHGAYPRWLPDEGWAGSLARLFWVGFSAQVATLPVLVLQFQRLSPWGWLATPLASLPLLGLQALGLLYMLGGFAVPGLHQVLGAAMALLGRLFLLLPSVLGEWRLGSLFLVRPSPLWLWLFAAALLAVFLGGRFRRAGWVLLLFACVGGWALPRPFESPRGSAMAVLDVGQASCQVLLSEGRALLLDAGNGVYRGRTSARQVIEPFLARVGVGQLDGIVITHFDADHAGSAADLIQDLPVGFLAYPEIPDPASPEIGRLLGACRRRGIRLLPLRRGMGVSGPWYSAQAWNPSPFSQTASENDRCLVLRVDVAGRSILFTGDIGFRAEKDMCRAGLTSRVDALLVPHHGSGRSSSPVFLRAVSPRWAVISAGRANRFGHPAPGLLQRLSAAGARVARTDLDGALLLEVSPRRMVIWKYVEGDWSARLAGGGQEPGARPATWPPWVSRKSR